MKTTIQIQNLKCDGCASTISKGLNALMGVSVVQVQPGNATVDIEYVDALYLGQAKKHLAKMGYPEVGAKNSLAKKAKSYLSCAIGKTTSSR